MEIAKETDKQGTIDYPEIFYSNWYKDIVYFLLNFSCPPEMEKSKRRAFKLKVVKYCILEDHIYWKDLMGVLLICVDESES